MDRRRGLPSVAQSAGLRGMTAQPHLDRSPLAISYAYAVREYCGPHGTERGTPASNS
jgi:hypothetical protein